jgi:hypothetical protein
LLALDGCTEVVGFENELRGEKFWGEAAGLEAVEGSKGSKVLSLVLTDRVFSNRLAGVLEGGSNKSSSL